MNRTQECINWINNNVQINVLGGREQLSLNPVQKELIENFFEKHFLCVVPSRQVGNTTGVAALYTYLLSNFDNIMLGALFGSTYLNSHFCDMVYSMINPLSVISKTTGSIIMKNYSGLYCEHVKNYRPQTAFHGRYLSVIFIDEAAFIPHIEDAFIGFIGSHTKCSEYAREAGKPYGTIINSVGNNGNAKIGGWFAKVVDSSKNDLQHMYHYMEASYDKVYDDDWYKNMCELFNHNQDHINAELNCFVKYHHKKDQVESNV